MRFVPGERTFKVWYEGGCPCHCCDGTDQRKSATVTMQVDSSEMLDEIFDVLNESFSKLWSVYGKYVYVDLE